MQPRTTDHLRRIKVPVVIGLLAVVLGVAMWGFGSSGPVNKAGYVAAGGSTPPPPPDLTPVPLPAWWPQRATLYTDSVGLGAVTALRETMPSWRIKVLGRPALMMDVASDELAESGDPVDKVVVVALGYNSLWERGREDFDYWSGLFDRNANRLIRTIHAAGGRKIVWVALRDAPASSIPKDATDQNRSFSWYFPWVNQRLHLLDRQRSDVVLADWSTTGDAPGLTYDAIHLDPDGALAYARMVKRAIVTEPYRPYDPEPAGT